MNRKLIRVGAFLGFVMSIVLVSGLGDELPTQKEISVKVPPLGTGFFRIPSRDEIAEIEIELYNSGKTFPNIPPFKIEEKYVSDVFSYFQGAHIDAHPDVLFPDSGSVRIRLKSGEILRIAIHKVVGDSPIQFSICGVRLKQDVKRWEEKGGNTFASFVSRVYYWQTGLCPLKLPSATIRTLGLEAPSDEQQRMIQQE